MKKHTFLLTFFLPLFGFSQDLEQLIKKAGVLESTEVLMELSAQDQSLFATEVPVNCFCPSFYLLIEPETNILHALGECSQQVIHEKMVYQNSNTSISFQEENSSTWIGKNDREWVIFNLDMIRTKGWEPVRISISEADSIYLLNEGHYLSIKGNQKWHHQMDGSGQVETHEVIFEGTSFVPFYGGILAPVKENQKQVYRYIQYQNFLVWNEEAQDNLPDPNFHYLKPDGKFQAEEILVYPSDVPIAVIKQNGQTKIYSFQTDSVIENEITSYFEIPWYGILTFSKDHISFMRDEWTQLPCNNPVKMELEEDGDIIRCKITKGDGTFLRIELPGDEVAE